jgi:hypothetical protein
VVTLYLKEKMEIIKDIQKLTRMQNHLNKKMLKCSAVGLVQDYNHIRHRKEELDVQIRMLINKIKS